MSDYLDDMIKRAKSRGDLWDDVGEVTTATDVPVASPTENGAVKSDSFDRLSWDMVCDQAPMLREHMVELAVDYETSPDAYEDLFHMLHKGDPRFRGMEEMLDSHKPQHALLTEMFGGESFGLLRKETRYDEYSTAFAMGSLQGAMREAFDRIKDAIDRAEQAEQALQEALENAEQAQGGGEGQDEAAAALEAALGAVEQAQEAGQETGSAAAGDMAETMSRTADDLRQEQQQMAGWGLGDGDLRNMSFDERRALAERLNGSKLKRLADLVGQFRMFADAERRRKVKHAPEEVLNITLGNDLTKLTTTELTNLAIPELEDQFWIRWSQHGLLQKDVRGVDREGKGPIIVVCDESQSMSNSVDAEGNTREAWSKAVSLALCDQAKRGARDFIYIGFASRTQQVQFDFPGGAAPIDKVIEFAEHFFNGGTSYAEPLSQALQVIRTYGAAGKPMPDVVFITDDECKVTGEFLEEWRRVKDENDVRCYGVQIGGDPYANNLKDIADHCISLSKLNSGPEGVQHIFRTI